MIDLIRNYLVYYLIAVNLIDFVIYGIDKRKAKKHKWRITEKTLLGFGLIGGAVGGLLGMQVFHHKTKHRYFYLINIIACALWIVLLFKIYR